MRSDRGADWLAFAEARRLVLAAVRPLAAIEEVAVGDALGRALAAAVPSPVDLPPWDNSAMDGFAVRSADVAGATAAEPRTLRVVDDVAAGGFPARPIGEGEACRLMTGAPVPDGADGVIRVEHTDGGLEIGTPRGRVEVRSDADAGRNVRRRGEDVEAGSVVLPAGATLGAAEVGVAAAVGAARVVVARRPRVAILATGDELVSLDAFEEVRAGRRIVSSNSYTLAAQLRGIGAEVVDLGIAPDDPAEIGRRLGEARGCDALITSAGVSVGEHDHLRAVLESLGAEVSFWRVRMRPGSPVVFGTVAALGGIPWFGLPGNPVSSVVTFEVLARPALLRLAGHAANFAPTFPVVLDADAPVPADLTHFLRVRLRRERGRMVASPTGAQGSGILTSLAAADALVVVPAAADAGSRLRGDRYTALLPDTWPPVREPGF